MTIELVITLFVLGLVGSFTSGMLGIGGAIVNYPILLYVPALLGVATYSAHDVSGMVAIQVLFATLSGIWAYRKGNYINKSLILYMGISSLIGSLIGSYMSDMFSEVQVNSLYAALATIAAVMMFLPKKAREDEGSSTISYNKWIATISAFLVGSAAGIVGAGGAFILVPIMMVVLRIPMRVTIATSLAITFISSIGTSFGKIMTGQVLFYPALILVVASLIAAPLGVKVGKKANTKVLRILLAVLIIATSIKIWFDILS